MNETAAGRIASAGLLIGLTMPVYMALNSWLSPRFDFMTDLDRGIPFVPWTVFVYLSFYLLLLLAAAFCPSADFTRIELSVLAANILCYPGFLLFPAHYPRPDPSAAGSLAWLFGWLYSSDAPGNTFPSIHAAASLCVGFSMPGKARVFFRAWAVCVAFSILTVKQHFIADFAGGAVVAGCSMLWARLRERRPADAEA